ncbi:YkgJ family cysteine cluster protein [Chitinimonas naiadis]
MNKPLIHLSNLDKPGTWLKYRDGLCESCMATCCTMPVEVKLGDLMRMQLVDAFEAEVDPPKQIAKRLMKAGVITHFNFKNSIFTLTRRANGDCRYLDANTRRCTIYATRPNTCRNHPMIGPRPGFCAYRNR